MTNPLTHPIPTPDPVSPRHDDTGVAGARGEVVPVWDVAEWPADDEWVPAWRGEFLRALRLLGNVTTAARQAGVERKTAYRARGNDDLFRLAWDDALEQATDRIELTAVRMSTTGIEVVTTRSKRKSVMGADGVLRVVEEEAVTDTTTFVSPQMAMFLLRSRRPELYSERARLELTGKDGEPLIPSELPAIDRLLEQKRAELAARDQHPVLEARVVDGRDA